MPRLTLHPQAATLRKSASKLIGGASRLFFAALLFQAIQVLAHDPRDFSNGLIIPDENYCDQPYVVVLENGDWLCTMTTGPGRESEPGQHVVATISSDKGRTWSPLIDIEPAGEIESSWVIPVKLPSGRIYAIYNYNGDHVRALEGAPIKNSALLGWYVYKFSDDGGRTWAHRRHRLPMPVAPVDLGNDWRGAVQLFWGIDKPIVTADGVMFAFTRLGRYLPRYPRAPSIRPDNDDWRRLAPSEKGEGWVYHSTNILTEPDPEKIRWRLLPDGGRGIRAPEYDPIQQEHNVVDLPDGTLHCIFRTAMGFVASSYSKDRGRTWSKPEPAVYAASGKSLKNSIACAAVWKTKAGKYLLWYHNNDDMRRGGSGPLEVASRNAAWLAAGTVRNGKLVWSQPELVCYQPITTRGASYPDLIEDGKNHYISATNKKEARVLPLNRELIDGLFAQDTLRSPISRGLVFAWDQKKSSEAPPAMPQLPDLKAGGGFSVELWLTAQSLQPGQVAFDTTTASGRGFRCVTSGKDNLEIQLSDGELRFAWSTDAGSLSPGKSHHVVFIVDGGPGMIMTVVDGQLCDGGTDRAYGYGRLRQRGEGAADLREVNGGPQLRIGENLDGEISTVRIYNVPLRISEAIASHRAGPPR